MKLFGSMRIGFDAKRAFFNHSGLGNYSRLIIDNISRLTTEDPIFAFTPKSKLDFYFPDNTEIISPVGINAVFTSLWRSKGVIKDLVKQDISIYHGLSNELPLGIDSTSMKSVVTIHDLIFLRYPELYKSYDRNIYLKKTKHAVEVADKVVAISEQTKRDLVEFLNVSEDKIVVHYQDCDVQFKKKLSIESIEDTKRKYGLPEKYVLSVGTIEERKNQLLTLKAAHKASVPVVFLGKKTSYYQELESYVTQYNLGDQVRFLEGVSFSDFPAIYQGALVLMYPSIFEGFGIPIVEAMNSGIPVITSKGSCFTETGGDAALYIENNVKVATDALLKVLNNSELREECVAKGRAHVEKFNVEKTIPELLQLYKDIVS